MITQTENTQAKSTITEQDRPQIRIQKNYEVKVSSCSYLTDDSLIALGNEDGSIQVIAANNGNNQYYLRSLDKTPVTSISLNPEHTTIKNAILVTHTGGTLQYWHTTSKQLLFQKNYEDFLFCSDIRFDASKYAFGGDKGEVRISNMDKSNPTILEEGHLGAHQNRVFCVKWSPYDANCLYSGGWDKTVYFWDIRVKTSINKLFGCFIGGQSIDIFENHILIGNNENEFPLKLYDLKADKMTSIHWARETQQQKSEVTGVLSCFFGHKSSNIVLAQSAKNEIRIFQDGKCTKKFEQDLGVKAESMQIAKTKKEILATWDNGHVHILKY